LPAPARQFRASTPAAERRGPSAGEEADRLARDWVSLVVDRAPLDEIERLPSDALRTELPGLLGRLLGTARGEGAILTRWQAARLASLVGFRGREDPTFAEVMGELADLEHRVAAHVHGGWSPAAGEPFPRVLERLGLALVEIRAAAAEEGLRRRSRALERLANTDPLTGLHNRRHLLEELERLDQTMVRYGHPYAVLVFDVVGLKAVNDSFGHAAGDRVLVDLARATEATVRTVDSVVRVAGDEFCVLAPNQTARAAHHLARRLSSAASALEGPTGQGTAISVGVAACPEHGDRGEDLLRRADAAMYRARAVGEEVGSASA
jgi:diguanylate cyclase (GGDEF)-like protein